MIWNVSGCSQTFPNYIIPEHSKIIRKCSEMFLKDLGCSRTFLTILEHSKTLWNILQCIGTFCEHSIVFSNVPKRNTISEHSKSFKSVLKCPTMIFDVPELSRLFPAILKLYETFHNDLGCSQTFQTVLENSELYRYILKCSWITRMFWTILEIFSKKNFHPFHFQKHIFQGN